MFVLSLLVAFFLASQEILARTIEARSTSPRLERKNVRSNLDTVSARTLIEHEVRSVSQHNVRDLTGISVDPAKDYGLRNSESFYWGRYGYPLANFTAYEESEHVKVLSMERFSAALSTAKCSSDSVKFTLTDKSQFSELQAEWSWVNSAADNYIVLVTENAKCNVADGDPGLRQPWHVTSATFDSSSFAVTFKAEPKTWEEAFSDWHMTVKTRGLLPTGTKVKREDPTLARRYTISGTPSIDLSTNFSDAKLTLGGGESVGGVSASIACADCSTSGTIDFELDVVPWVIPPHLSGTLTIIGNDVGASFGMNVVAQVPLAAGASGSETVWEQPVPDVGISISGLIDMGLDLKLNIAAGIGQTTAGFTISTGVDITIPSGSTYKVDFDDSSQNELIGWTPSFSPKSPSMSGSVAMIANVGSQFIMEFGGTVAGIAAEVGVMLAAPTLGISATAISGTDICDIQGAGFGVELGIEWGGSIDTFEIASLADVANIGATQTLIATELGSISTCLTVVKASVAPSASFTPSAPAVSNVPIFSLTPSGSLSATPSSGAAASGSSSNVPSSSVLVARSSSIITSSSIPVARSSSNAASASAAASGSNVAPSGVASVSASSPASSSAVA